MIFTHDGQYPSEHFVDSDLQIISLSGYRNLEPGAILVTPSAPLLRVPLQALAPHDSQNDVTPVMELPMPSASPSLAISVTPDTLDEHPSKLLRRLTDAQRKSFLHFWKTVPFPIRRIDFALDAPGCWDPSTIDALSATLTEYADMFFSSIQDCGDCSLCPFEIKVPPGTQPIQSRPYTLNPVSGTSRRNLGLLSCRRPHPAIHVSMVQLPRGFRRNSAKFESQSTIKN